MTFKKFTFFLARRIFWMALILLGVAVVTFLIFYIFPSDPGKLVCGKPCTVDNLNKAHQFMGTDLPIWQQMWDFLAGIFVGRTYGEGITAVECSAPCLGYSFGLQQTVTEMILQRLPVTISIALGAAVLWLIIGVSSGIICALKEGKWPDKVLTSFAMFGLSAPSYLIGMLAIYLFGFVLRWLPTGGYVPIFPDFGGWFNHLILPWLVLALLSSASYTRITRSEMLTSMSSDYFRTARAKGMTLNSVLLNHGVRNASIPVVTMFGMGLGSLLSGAVITEKVFSMNGLGSLLIDAVMHTDLQEVCGIILFSSFILLVANLVVDIACTFLDPRFELK